MLAQILTTVVLCGLLSSQAVAEETLESAAGRGNRDAQRELGSRFHDGDGVPQNFELAFHWWLKAANQGDAAVQEWIGDMYRTGTGVDRDHNEALHWFERSARAEDIEGMASLARLLATSPDPEIRSGSDAVSWAERLVEKMNVSETQSILALALAEWGRFEEALKAQDKALRLFKEGQYSRGGELDNHEVVYREQRSYIEARKPWRSSN